MKVKNTSSWQSEAVVIAAGEMRNQAFWQGLTTRCSRIICADGGWLHCQQLDIRPSMIIGDMDSAKQVPDDITIDRHNPDKEKSDSQLAIEAAFAQGAERVYCLGGVGSRLDHSQGNLQLLKLYPQRLYLADGDFEAVAINSEFSFSATRGETCSLISATAMPAIVTTEGLRFALQKSELRADSHGLSNIVSHDEVRITVSQGMVLLFRIWQPFSNRQLLAS